MSKFTPVCIISSPEDSILGTLYMIPELIPTLHVEPLKSNVRHLKMNPKIDERIENKRKLSARRNERVRLNKNNP